MFCCTLLYVHSSIAIILMWKRELIALLNFSSWCLVMVERLFLAVPRGCLQFVIVVFPDHTHLLFLLFTYWKLSCLFLLRATIQLYTWQGYLIFYPGFRIGNTLILSYPGCHVGSFHLLYCNLLHRLLVIILHALLTTQRKYKQKRPHNERHIR